MASDGQDRTEEATSRRRSDARKKGTVARSSDLTNAVVMVAFLIAIPGALAQLAAGSIQMMRTSLSGIPPTLSGGGVTAYAWQTVQPTLTGLGIIFAVAVVVGVASNFAQVGLHFSPEAMVPSFGKINPLEGFKRLVSVRVIFEGAKALSKFLVFGFIAFSAIRANWSEMMGLGELAPTEALAVVGMILRSIATKIVFAWAVVAGIDYFFQRKQTDKQLRMTKDEVKREVKEAESSPEVKAARMARMRKLVKGRMMDAVRTADVVVTNPTHYAVAIKYDQSKGAAPIVVAKGADLVAARIREEAKKARVPLVPNPPLARALYRKCEVGDYVPRELFQAVAEVLAYVYKALKKVPVSGA